MPEQPRNSWRVARPTAQPLPPKVEGLLESADEAIPVRMKIYQDDVLTGWDDGALGFEKDCVWFSGQATSFRIVAPDILPGAYLCSGVEAVTDGEALKQGLPLRHATRDVWIRFEVLVTHDRRDWEDEALLVREIKRLRARPDAPGQSEYPPLSVRPGILRPRNDLRRQLIFAGGGMLLIVISIPQPFGPIWAAVIRAVGIIGANLAWVGTNLNDHKLRQIAGEEVA